MNRTTLASILMLALLPALCAAQIPDAKDLRLEPPAAGGSSAARTSNLDVSLAPDRGHDGIYWIGDRLRFTVRVNDRAYVKLIEVGTSGSITEIVPRGTDGTYRLDERTAISLPASGTFVVEGPIGEETVIAIASREPLPWIEDLYSILTAGATRRRSYGTIQVASAAKDLRLLPADEDEAPQDRVEQFCRRVAQRAASRGASPTSFAVTRFRIR